MLQEHPKGTALLDLGHPAHVHFFKPVGEILQAHGLKVVYSAQVKDVMPELLDWYNIPATITGTNQSGLLRKTLHTAKRILRLLVLIADETPSVVSGLGDFPLAIAAKLAGVPSVIFNDSEPVIEDEIATHRFATCVVTPEWFGKSIGPKQRRVRAFKELAYLDPSRLIHDESFRQEAGLDDETRYVVIRLVSWSAGHDIGVAGFSYDDIRELIRRLPSGVRPLIIAEGAIPQELSKYSARVPPALVHSLLAGATAYIGDSQTMATEAALLGIPSIRCNDFVGDDDMENFKILESRYQLLRSFRDPTKAIEELVRVVSGGETAGDRSARRDALFRDCDDMARVMAQIIMEYNPSG